MLRLGLVAAVATIGAAHARSESVLVISVGDVKTGGFIADAQVRLPAVGRVERTKWNGEATFAGIAYKSVRIQVRAIGYAPGDIETPMNGDTTAVHFQLERLAPVLDTVRVKATRADRHLVEFETRRSAGLGRFITDSVITAENAKGLQQLLVSHVPGLKVAGRGVKSMQASPSLLRLTDGCAVALYLDGFKLTNPGADTVDLEPININELAGIEVYNQVNAPVQYKPTGEFCKVILLWTKY